MKSNVRFGLVIIGALVFCLAAVQPGIAASAEEEVLKLEENFIKAGTTSDLELMSTLYWHSSKTSSYSPNTLKVLNQGWEESLEKLWKYRFDSSTGTTSMFMTFDHPQVIMLKDDVAILLGYETIIQTDSTTNAQSAFEYRLTRVVQKIGGKWLIVHEHVSALPEE